MELSRSELENVKFQTKGKWYRAEQVDSFIEELIVSLDEAERKHRTEKQEWRRLEIQVAELREELEKVSGERDALRENPPVEKAPVPVSPVPPETEALKKEQEALLQDVKRLCRFREEFRRAVERDVKKTLDGLDSMESEKLL